MTISGSTDFSMTRTQILDGALLNLGVLRSGATVTSDSNLESDCAFVLNSMLKHFINMGMELWTRKETSFTATADKTSYTLAPAGNVAIDVPERLVQAWIQNPAGNDTIMHEIAMWDYRRLSDKDSSGTSTQFAYDYTPSQGTFYPWPIPTLSTSTYYIVYHKPYDDMDAAANTLDFPQRWYDALLWNLTVRLAPQFGYKLTPDIRSLAQTTLMEAQRGGFEGGSVQFVPNPRMRWHG